MYKQVIISSLLIVLLASVVSAVWWAATDPSDRAYYFIEHNENNIPLSNGRIWVKGNFGTTPTTFYVYYNGNAEDTSRKNGDMVFEIFDEFMGNSLNTSKWMCATGTCTVSNGIASHTMSGCSSYYYGIRSQAIFPFRYAAFAYARASANANYVLFVRMDVYDTNHDVRQIKYQDGTYVIRTMNEGVTSDVPFSASFTSYALHELRHNASTVKYYVNRNYITQATNNLPDQNLYFTPIIGCNNLYTYVDYAFLIKDSNTYVQNAPTYGPEQTGSWTLNGITYTKRKQVSITFTASVSNQQAWLDYSQFNSPNIVITSYSPPILQPSENTTYNTTAYEYTTQRYTTRTTNYNITQARLEYNGVNITATRINNTHAYATVNLPYISTNNTIRQFRWHIYNGSTWRAFNYRNQSIVFASQATAVQRLPYVQHGTQTTINLTVVEYMNLSQISSARIEFNGVNYTMNKLSDNKFTYTITLPTQTEFSKSYNIKLHYFVNNTIKRNTLTSTITGIKYITPQLPCSEGYLEKSNNLEKLTFQGKTIYAFKNNSATNCVNELTSFVYLYSSSGSNVIFANDDYIYYSADSATTPLIEFQSHLPFVQNKTFTVSLGSGCSSLSGYFSMTIRNSTGSSISIGNGETARWTFDTTTGHPVICKVGTSSCIRSMDAKYSIRLVKTSSYTCTALSTWYSSNSYWLFNASYSFRTDKGKYMPYIYIQESFTETPTTQYTTAILKNRNTNANYSLIIIRNIANSPSVRGVEYDRYSITNPTNIQQVLVIPNANGFRYQYNEQIANRYSAYVLTTNAQIITPKWNIYIAKNTYGQEHTIYYNRISNTTYATTLYKDTATFIIDKFGNCYFVPPYSPANLSAYQTLTGYQMPCEITTKSIDALPLMPTLQLCYVDGNKFKTYLKYQTNVLVEEIKKVNGVVQYSQTLTNEFNKTYTIDNSLNEVQIKVNNEVRCYWSNKTKILGIGELPHSPLSDRLIGYPLLIFTTAISIYNPFLFIGAIAVNEFFKLVDVFAMFLLAGAIGLYSFISAWEGERTLKTLITLLLITTAYVVQLSSISGVAASQTNALNSKVLEITQAFTTITTSNDIIQIITTAIPTFLISLFVLLLSLPALVVDAIFAPIILVVPQLANGLMIFKNALVIGAYAWLMLKIYELGRNTFRGV